MGAQSKTVLVTGVTGFLGLLVAEAHLNAGYKVKGTVRSIAKSKDLIAQLFNDSVELVEVPDIATSDFTAALHDVDFIAHVASPYTFKIQDPKKDLLDPAVQGTLNVLRQAVKANIRKVVITSSFAAVTNLKAGGPWREYTYTDKDWNPSTYDECLQEGVPAPFIYSASKKLAEQAAFDFQKEHADKIDIVTLNPPMIYAPNKHIDASLDKLNTSSATIYHLISGQAKIMPDNRLPFFCDGRDVALAHVRALESEEANNKRFIISSPQAFTWQDATQFLKEKRPEIASRLPPQDKEETRPLAKLDSSPAERILKMQFKLWQETLLDTVDYLLAKEKEYGWQA